MIRKATLLLVMISFYLFSIGQIESSKIVVTAQNTSSTNFNTDAKGVIKVFNYDNGEIGGGIGSSGGAHDFGAFIKIPAADLEAYVGQDISAIHFAVDNNSILTSAELKIFENDIESTPVVVEDINIDLIQSGWNLKYLSTPYTIPEGTSIFIGVHVFTNAGGFTLSIDSDGAQSPSLSGFVYFNGAYAGTLASNNIDGDFNMQALIYDEVPQNDIAITKVNIPSIIESGSANIGATIINKAATPLTSFDIVYSVDEYTSSVYSVVDINVESGDSYIVTHDAAFDFAEIGSYTVSCTVTNPNGNVDEDESNNDLATTIEVVELYVAKKQLFEHFTSSTCPPCAGYTPTANSLLDDNEGAYSLIRYQASWPGSGDPYTTADVASRVSYYGVNAVPSVYRNGTYEMDVTQSVFDDYAELASDIRLSVEASFDGTIVRVTPTLNPIVDLPAGLVAHIAVVENKTTGNVGTNGETEFRNVLMKMLPSSSGEQLGALMADSDFVYSYVYDMSDTFVEEMDDLTAVVFVQNSAGDILQSEMVAITAGTVTPTLTVTLQITDGENAIENAEVDFSDSTYTSDALGEVKISVPSDGDYIYEVVAEGFEKVIDTVTVAGSDVTQIVTMDSVGVSVNDNVNGALALYPNPTTGSLYIVASVINTVNVFSVSGMLVKTMTYQNVNNATLNLDELESGVYFVSVNTKESNYTQRIVKK